MIFNGLSAVTSISAWTPNNSCVFDERNSGTTPSGRASRIVNTVAFGPGFLLLEIFNHAIKIQRWAKTVLLTQTVNTGQWRNNGNIIINNNNNNNNIQNNTYFSPASPLPSNPSQRLWFFTSMVLYKFTYLFTHSLTHNNTTTTTTLI